MLSAATRVILQSSIVLKTIQNKANNTSHFYKFRWLDSSIGCNTATNKWQNKQTLKWYVLVTTEEVLYLTSIFIVSTIGYI